MRFQSGRFRWNPAEGSHLECPTENDPKKINYRKGLYVNSSSFEVWRKKNLEMEIMFDFAPRFFFFFSPSNNQKYSGTSMKRATPLANQDKRVDLLFI
jgi:hypothetical protein